MQLKTILQGIGLNLIKRFYPPFHPIKYKYINWAYGQQSIYSIWDSESWIGDPKTIKRPLKFITKN